LISIFILISIWDRNFNWLGRIILLQSYKKLCFT